MILTCLNNLYISIDDDDDDDDDDMYAVHIHIGRCMLQSVMSTYRQNLSLR